MDRWIQCFWRLAAVGFLCASVILSAAYSVVLAQATGPSYHEQFDGAETSWRFAASDTQYRLDQHRRAPGEGRSGSGCESLTITASNGSYVYIAHPMPKCRVVSELVVRLWLKASRSDLQLLARVIFPNAQDPKTGRPLFALVRGSSYRQTATWQELQIVNFPQLVERQIRVLRAEHGSQIDTRGAYIDLVVLNAYGGQGQTQLWIDDLEVAGAVKVDDTMQPAAKSDRGVAPTVIGSSKKSVALRSSILYVDDRPIFPRIIEHQGEPLAYLAEMGFNGIRMGQAPSAELIAEAEQSGMWIVAPPPLLNVTENSGRSEVPPIPAIYDRVLAWSLGQNLTAADFDAVAERARQLRVADRQRRRPMVCAPETDLLRYSREVRDLLSVYRFPLSSSLELADYGHWLRERSRLARPGTPVWTVIQTQLPAAVRAQCESLNERAIGSIDEDALRLLVFTAVGAGVRGMEFASHSPLNANDDDTRRRALALSILNTELDMIEPWAAAGSRTIAADSNDPEVKAVVLQYETSRLLLVTRIGPHAQYVPKHSTGKTVSLVVPGIPESHDLIELTAGGLRPLSHKRVAGGTLITLDDFDMTGFVLITPDPLMVNVLSRRLAGVAQRTAIWQRELAARTLARIAEVERRLPPEVQDPATSATLLAAAQRDLEEADKNLTAQNRQAAFVASRHAMASLGHLRRQHWMRAVNKSRSTAAGPLLASFDTLPEHWHFTAALRDCLEQTNQLPAGDCEDFQTLLRTGWRHVKHPLDGVDSTVEIVPGGPSPGQSCLRMEVRSVDARSNTTLVESAPVWVTSAAVHLARGQMVCIRGKVRVPSPVRGSVDGLMIVDSLGGESLAERIGQTNGWEEFALYRAAPCDIDVNVTFALTGYGEAFIDDISIQPVNLVSPQATPSFPQSQSSNAANQRASTDVGASPNGGPRNSGLPVRQAQRTRQLFSPPRR